LELFNCQTPGSYFCSICPFTSIIKNGDLYRKKM